jgi:hypothetical protein
MAGVGLAVGLLFALALSEALGAVLTGIGPQDPLAFGGSLVGLLAASAAASLIPASRVGRGGLLTSLRED